MTNAETARRSATRIKAERKLMAETTHQPEINWMVLATIREVLALEATRPQAERKTLAARIMRAVNKTTVREISALGTKLQADKAEFAHVLKLLEAHGRIHIQEIAGRAHTATFVIKAQATDEAVKDRKSVV